VPATTSANPLKIRSFSLRKPRGSPESPRYHEILTIYWAPDPSRASKHWWRGVVQENDRTAGTARYKELFADQCVATRQNLGLWFEEQHPQSQGISGPCQNFSPWRSNLFMGQKLSY
jgi:hypothetical protein